MLTPKQKQEISISFTPEEAKVVIATAVIKLLEGEETLRVIKMSAIGKYPFLTISQEKIDFESILVGNLAQKDVIFRNNSLVPAHFSIERLNDDGKDDSFTLNIM